MLINSLILTTAPETSQQPSFPKLVSNEEIPQSPSAKPSVNLSPETMIVHSQEPVAITSQTFRDISLEYIDEALQFSVQQKHEDYVGEISSFSSILEQLKVP